MPKKIQPVEFYNILYKKHCRKGKVEFYYPGFDEHRIFPVTNLTEKSLLFPRNREVIFGVVACDAKGRKDENLVEIPVKGRGSGLFFLHSTFCRPSLS